MTNDIRQSLARLEQISSANLDAVTAELNVLLAAVQKEVQAQSSVLKEADTTHAAYSAAASDLVGLLQLSQVTIEARAELGKLTAAAKKTLQRVWKKAPK